MPHHAYKGKKVLITGHTGFKGSWLALWLHNIGAEVAGYSLAPLELSHFNILNLKIKNYFHDINDEAKLKKVMKEFRPDIIFHLAAQSLVIDSYADPVGTYNTNVLGSLKVYSAALHANVPCLVSVTTDKVYENREWPWGYRENDVLGGHDPYSSSKACVEIMTDSFRRSFLASNQMLLATARAGNVIGGGDWASNRLIPDLVRGASAGNVTAIRNPESVRPWQHVLEPLNGYLLIGAKLLNGESKFATSYNFGPNSNDAVSVKQICEIANKSWDRLKFKFEHSDKKLHEAGILKLDISKAIAELDWFPTWDTETSIIQTISWYKNYYTKGICQSLDDVKKFESRTSA